MDMEKNKVLERVVYAVMVMLGLLLLAVLGKWVFEPKSEDQNILVMCVQWVLGAGGSVLAFYLGSSLGSRKKDEIAANTLVTSIAGLEPVTSVTTTTLGIKDEKPETTPAN